MDDKVVTPLAKLAKAILWRSAKDMTPEWGDRWLTSESTRIMCANAEVDYNEFVDAMKFIMTKSDIQRSLLLQKLKKNIGL